MLDRYNYHTFQPLLYQVAAAEIWAAGVRVNPLADVLGLEQTRGGRLVIKPDLSAPMSS